MNVQSHVETLKVKHSDIEKVIARELLRPQPDSVRITKLKREKLLLKEEMSRFSA